MTTESSHSLSQWINSDLQGAKQPSAEATELQSLINYDGSHY